MIALRQISLRVGGNLLLDAASAQIADGDRIGLVGANGTGKTTLLRAIAGEIGLEGGEIEIGKNRRIGTVPQTLPNTADSLLETVLKADRERTGLLAEAEDAKDPHRIAEIHERLVDIEAHGAPARAGAILAGLGFEDAAQNGPLNALSGGWRMRVALASCLFLRPDILLLDEPTNHLDLEAAMWLQGFLSSYPRTLIIVSHDRTLLNSVPSAILHLQDHGLTLYRGTYDTFERTRAERLANQEAMRRKQQQERRHIQKFVDRFRYKASKARQAQSRIKMLERMQPIAAVIEARTAHLSFPDPEPLAAPILALDDGVLGYGDGPVVLQRLTLRLGTQDRIGLLGQNGNGKSTLMRLLAGHLTLRDGRIQRSNKLVTGYFSQDVADQLDPTDTALDAVRRTGPELADSALMSHLGRFGLGQAKSGVKIASLSGGEKARLAIALICRWSPHLLLLDEPTNHLDIDTRQALVQALAAYEGTVVLASHDWHLLNATVDELWLVAERTCTRFDGSLEDYRDLLARSRASERARRRADGRDGPRNNRKQARQARAMDRAATAASRAALKQAEADLNRLAGERKDLHDRLSDPALYEDAPDRLAALSRRVAEVDVEIAAAEARWLDASERLEE